MNNELVKQEIEKIISENVNPAWRQYPVAKHQIVTLTELGIIDLMPANFGHTDAKVVIEATEEKTTGNFDDVVTFKSKLMELINESDEIIIQVNEQSNETFEYNNVSFSAQFSDENVTLMLWHSEYCEEHDFEDEFGDCEVEVESHYVKVLNKESTKIAHDDNDYADYEIEINKVGLQEAAQLWLSIYAD